MPRASMLRAIWRAAIGTAAVIAASAAYVWITVPDVRPLKRENPATTAFMAMRADEARAAGKPVRHVQRWVSYDRISSNLKRLVLLAEDDGFFQHHGVDLVAMQDALKDTIQKGEPLRGASTITQQLAKNLYLSPSRNPYRKLTELFIARRLEAELTKRRILEIYLNVVEWGDGIWGAEAASQTYFGVAAADLSPEQAALLAGSLSSPRRLNPAHPGARLLWQQNMLLKKMK